MKFKFNWTTLGTVAAAFVLSGQLEPMLPDDYKWIAQALALGVAGQFPQFVTQHPVPLPVSPAPAVPVDPQP